MAQQVTMAEAVKSLQAMFPTISEDALNIALKANSTECIQILIDYVFEQTVDFLLSYSSQGTPASTLTPTDAQTAVVPAPSSGAAPGEEEKKAPEASSARPKGSPSAPQRPEAKVDADALLALELQQEEYEQAQSRSKARPNPTGQASAQTKRQSEGKQAKANEDVEIVFACRTPVNTYVCLHPEHLTKGLPLSYFVQAPHPPSSKEEQKHSEKAESGSPPMPEAKETKKEAKKTQAGPSAVEELQTEEFEPTKLDV